MRCTSARASGPVVTRHYVYPKVSTRHHGATGQEQDHMTTWAVVEKYRETPPWTYLSTTACHRSCDRRYKQTIVRRQCEHTEGPASLFKVVAPCSVQIRGMGLRGPRYCRGPSSCQARVRRKSAGCKSYARVQVFTIPKTTHTAIDKYRYPGLDVAINDVASPAPNATLQQPTPLDVYSQR